MKPIRNSAKAVILRGEAVLMIRCRDREGDFYILPGGGQRPDETLADALVRECAEEIGCPVEVGPLRFVCEYLLEEKTFDWQKSLHQMEFMFLCALPGGAEPKTGSAPDDIQAGVEWMPLSRLEAARHYPPGLARALLHPDETPVYWGDVVR